MTKTNLSFSFTTTDGNKNSVSTPTTTTTTTTTTTRCKSTTALLQHNNPCLTNNTQEQQQRQQQEEKLEQDPFLTPSIEMVKEVADSIRGNVREYTRHHKLKLVGITAAAQPISECNDNLVLVDQGGADTYSECIRRTCEEDGIDYEVWRVPSESMSSTAHVQMQTLIDRANHLVGIDGILVYYPLFNKPYILGLPNGDNGDNDDDNHNKGAHTSTHKWTLECQEKRIQNGCQSILMRNKHKWPCMSYKTIDDYYRNSINPFRDVEGLCSEYHNRKRFRDQHLYVDRYVGYGGDGGGGFGRGDCVSSSLDENINVQENSTIFPCTALAVLRILKRCLGGKEYDLTKPLGRRLEGVTVTIFNRSQIMGRPLASLLANDGACVYSVDEYSVVMIKTGDKEWNRCYLLPKQDVKSCVEKSSVIVTGVPCSNFRIPTVWIKPNTTVVNVASEPNIDVDELAKIPGIQYIPAVGKVTVALLEHNLVQLHKKKTLPMTS